VQRILLELLNQMDGFDQTTNVKVSGGWFTSLSYGTFVFMIFLKWDLLMIA
jgi:hypothetical protein